MSSSSSPGQQVSVKALRSIYRKETGISKTSTPKRRVKDSPATASSSPSGRTFGSSRVMRRIVEKDDLEFEKFVTRNPWLVHVGLDRRRTHPGGAHRAEHSPIGGQRVFADLDTQFEPAPPCDRVQRDATARRQRHNRVLARASSESDGHSHRGTEKLRGERYPRLRTIVESGSTQFYRRYNLSRRSSRPSAVSTYRAESWRTDTRPSRGLRHGRTGHPQAVVNRGQPGWLLSEALFSCPRG